MSEPTEITATRPLRFTREVTSPSGQTYFFEPYPSMVLMLEYETAPSPDHRERHTVCLPTNTNDARIVQEHLIAGCPLALAAMEYCRSLPVEEGVLHVLDVDLQCVVSAVSRVRESVILRATFHVSSKRYPPFGD